MMITRPMYRTENEFLFDNGLNNTSLTIKNGDGSIQKILNAPNGGWTHDLLEQVDCGNGTWEAYLNGTVWIGSSEV